MLRRGLVIVVCLLAAVTTTASARADAEADKTAITERLRVWTAAFNTHDAAGICDLFAPDLVVTIPGALEGNREALCGGLAALQARPDLQLHYDNPDIREIIISGDLAVVRIVWTLTTRKGADQDVTTEAGIDIFKRQPDGRWSIARMATFTTRPNKILQ
jgi:uncharacterized protein (TIGR02246 family)